MSVLSRSRQLIGIDLGTTYSAAAYLSRDGTPVTIRNAEGELTTPSVVLFEHSGDVVVGRDARAAARVDPQSVADYAKRDMGEQVYSRPINGRTLSPITISGLILKKLKQDAEAQLGTIAGAVITVPAYFDETRRQATVAAGRIAGLPVLDIINEPTAAALAYVFRDFVLAGGKGDAFVKAMDRAKPHTAVIYDLGGGTFDVTAMRIEGRQLHVLATDGDVRLGGYDWDKRIVDHAAELFAKRHGHDPREDPVGLQTLSSLAEQAKRDLTQHATTRFAINHSGHNLVMELTRDQFEQMTDDLLYRTECRLDRVITAAALTWSKVDSVLTVGGSTRMPQVLNMLQRATGKEPDSSLAPDEVVAHGAAIHAVIRAVQAYDRKRATEQATPAKAGANDEGGGKLALEGVEQDVPRLMDEDDPSSGSATRVKELANAGMAQLRENSGRAAAASEEILDPALLEVIEEDPGNEFDNDLTSVLKAIQTINVNAHSLGVVIKDSWGQRVNSIVIARNTPLPTSVTRRYGTVMDNQSAVSIRAVEGEAAEAEACIQIGKCSINPLPAGLRKGATIYVTFSYDNSGRLHVKASEASSGSSASTTIYRQQSLEPHEVESARRAVAEMKVS